MKLLMVLGPLLALAASPAFSADPATDTPPAPSVKLESSATVATSDDDDEEKLECSRESRTGSRLNRRVVCTTRAERDSNAQESGALVERINGISGQQAPQGR